MSQHPTSDGADLPPGRTNPPTPHADAPAEDRAFAAVVASVERLDALGLTDERGLSLVEPATTFEPAS